MSFCGFTFRYRSLAVFLLVLFFGAAGAVAEQPTPAAVAAFNTYISGVENRLAGQHRARPGFLASSDSARDQRLRRGELIIEKITQPAGADLPGTTMPGAMLHHWRGTAFAPGARVADFERLLMDFSDYPQHYAPQVTQARLLSKQGDGSLAQMRVRQKHVITVVMDIAYDIGFGRLDAQHGYSTSRSTRIAEIDAPGTGSERALSGDEQHGYLWRLNSYWSYEERDGGLYMQIESVSLTRDVPRGLGWAIGPFVESVPRESLEFTLRSTCNALRR
jgi:hypothetical protein